MLISRDYKDKNKTLYVCDRCGMKVNIKNKKSIYVGNESEHPIKKWDLCNKCYNALEKGINK